MIAVYRNHIDYNAVARGLHKLADLCAVEADKAPVSTTYGESMIVELDHTISSLNAVSALCNKLSKYASNCHCEGDQDQQENTMNIWSLQLGNIAKKPAFQSFKLMLNQMKALNQEQSVLARETLGMIDAFIERLEEQTSRHTNPRSRL